VETILKKLKILPLQSQYLLSILLFAANNIHLFKSNSEVYKNNTRHSFDLHLPSPRLTTYQKGTFYMGIRCFNNLPFDIKALVNNVKLYKVALKIFFICIHSIHCRNILTKRIISELYILLYLVLYEFNATFLLFLSYLVIIFVIPFVTYFISCDQFYSFVSCKLGFMECE
jgi:hypothetical protein